MTPARPAPFAFDRSWEFPIDPPTFWSIVRETDRFPLWWGWLRSFDSGGLVVGATTDFVVQGALPYQLHFVVEVTRVVEPRLVETQVAGHLEGPASLGVEPAPDGSRVRLSWELEPRDPTLRRLAALSHPLLAWSHDQVVDLGVRQFRRRIGDRST